MSLRLPLHFERLSDADKGQYRLLQAKFHDPSSKNRRGGAIQQFHALLQEIRAFIVRGDTNDQTRSLVCGLCWLSDTLAVNTSQLSLMTNRSKSSINGSLALMCYQPIPGLIDAALITYFPGLKNDNAELRKWTVRKRVFFTPPPDLSSLRAGEEKKEDEYPRPNPWEDDFAFRDAEFHFSDTDDRL
jgi:hypothetical protein